MHFFQFIVSTFSKNCSGSLSVIFFFSFQFSVAFHIETSQSKQMTGFYMKCNSGLKPVKMSKAEIV